jgi:hypothetical protein
VPHVAPLQPAPDNVQVTPLLPESFVTVAMKLCGVPTCTAAVGSDMATEIAADGGVLPPSPLEFTDPAHPEINANASSVTTAIERGLKPVLVRFTVESPNLVRNFFLEL